MIPERYAYLTEKLNFPEFSFDLKNVEGKIHIYDQLRKKYLVLTPEEWVRQHMIQYLIQFKNYPKSLISLEKGLIYNSLNKRFDLLTFNQKGEPLLLIECKAPEVQLNKKTVNQVTVYNQTIQAEIIGISNGKQHFFYRLNKEVNNYQQLTDLPNFI
ncbi:type I restriction enzyme HsdR N-terminal domain-containing protein [Mongoliitalea daihaiensis]|uniref:type I restriction enzyme HsdR N-terminal domain-containing protein n=1 Tax=Mongoliitalea daihaiensis TaxID=2782006 RepID=UPI001F1DF3F9|nr:type I restriction enzyme HsdR N-terminal domain-containing protein [Mongoliitalea daihaiensis]UJP64773.1 type I restriction enzyme HsdR N-terminal domain-containing protein [Mongoliitalea daihaiensis]